MPGLSAATWATQAEDLPCGIQERRSRYVARSTQRCVLGAFHGSAASLWSGQRCCDENNCMHKSTLPQPEHAGAIFWCRGSGELRCPQLVRSVLRDATRLARSGTWSLVRLGVTHLHSRRSLQDPQAELESGVGEIAKVGPELDSRGGLHRTTGRLTLCCVVNPTPSTSKASPLRSCAPAAPLQHPLLPSVLQSGHSENVHASAQTGPRNRLPSVVARSNCIRWWHHRG